ncbi:MAG: HD-GYP domain-containing protein [Lachnospiraceae bacterium]|nr:HD-GYP domain-containing protein [Lachnospiraceae bacterium]
MFSTISVLSIRGIGSAIMLVNKSVTRIVDMVGGIILYVAGWLLYRLVICSLAKLTGITVKMNWKIFTIPPAIFSYFYMMSIVLIVAANKNNSVDGKTTFLLYVFSSIISFLFIWAFYVIIGNINTTDEAVKAKDEAVLAQKEVKALSVEIMEALAHTIDAKDEYTRGHSVRVADYSRMIAEKMGLSAEECENTYYMGLLHDLGKIGVPNEIINSPTKLTDEQYAVIKTHPALGFDILSEIKSRPDLVIGARWHHERYDGKGYPDGKSGDDIPLIARIIAVADSYDAMTSNRSYRKYMPQDKVRSEIEKNAGTQFDPEVAKCMISIIESDVEYKLHE